MKNRKPTDKQIKNVYCEHHSNLALLTTAIAMVTFMVLMLIYMGTMGNVNPQRALMAYSISPVIGVVCWIAAAALCIIIATKKKKYLIEYAVYALVMGFGLFFMYKMPAFVYTAFKGHAIATNWAKTVFLAVAAFGTIYVIVSVVWHLILATPGKSKK